MKNPNKIEVDANRLGKEESCKVGCIHTKVNCLNWSRNNMKHGTETQVSPSACTVGLVGVGSISGLAVELNISQ